LDRGEARREVRDVEEAVRARGDVDGLLELAGAARADLALEPPFLVELHDAAAARVRDERAAVGRRGETGRRAESRVAPALSHELPVLREDLDARLERVERED